MNKQGNTKKASNNKKQQKSYNQPKKSFSQQPKERNDKKKKFQNQIKTKPNTYGNNKPYKVNDKSQIKPAKPVKVTKRKMAMSKFVKISENDFSFECVRMISLLPENIRALFDNVEKTPFGLTKHIAELSLEKTPNFTTRENVLWEFKISANKVSVKTDEYCTFGWWVKYRINEDGKKDTLYHFFISIYDEDLKMEKLLKENGYSLFSSK